MFATLPETVLPPTPGAVLVGFSGGLDSSVLLHWLAEQPAIRQHTLRAIHVCHGLHPDAERWVEHCRAVCAALGVELLVARVNVRLDSGLGLEGAAREARYQAFAEHLPSGATLALAHHQDDQAETVLLRFLRASGSDGLAGMPGQRVLGPGLAWRPLLERPRSELLAFAHARGIRWLEDPANLDHGLDRNFLRHRILPALRERWPHAPAALAASAALLAEDATLLRTEAARLLATTHGSDPRSLSVHALLELDVGWQARVLREWFRQLKLPPLPRRTIAAIESQLLHARSDARAQCRLGSVLLERWRDSLHVQVDVGELPAGWQQPWDGREALQLPTGDSLALLAPEGSAQAAVEEAVTVSTNAGVAVGIEGFEVCARAGGERIRLAGRPHTHSLKHCLQQMGVPPWDRRRLPLLKAADGELLAAGDDILSERFARYCSENNVSLRWIRADSSAD